MPINSLQRAGIRHHIHTSDQIINQDTGDPGFVTEEELAEALATIEVTEEIAQNFYNTTSITEIVNEITEVSVANSYITQITQNSTFVTNVTNLSTTVINGKKGQASELATLDADSQLTHSQVPSELKTFAIPYIVDGGGSAITTGSKGFLTIPFACTITAVILVADQTGSVTFTIKKGTPSFGGGTIPTMTSIVASAKPTLSSKQISKDSTLSGWTTSVAADDLLEFVVDTVSTITRVEVSLTATRTV